MADLPLAPYVPVTHSRCHLRADQRRGLITLGDLAHASPDGSCTWLSADILVILLLFSPPPLEPYPPLTIPHPVSDSSGS